MITNILLLCGVFACGAVIGAVAMSYKFGKAIVKTSNMYKEETGNDFISWINQKYVEMRIARMYECAK